MQGRRLWIHLMLCLLLLVARRYLVGQVNTGDVLGRVIDASGAVLPDAKVTIKNAATGASRTVQTGNTGDYSFSLLQVGTYEVTIEAKGFRTVVTKDLNLSAGDRLRVDSKMAIGMANESVLVPAESALQTDSSTIETSITTETVADLPLNGRNLTNLVQLSPGVTEGASNAAGGGNHSTDRRLTSAFSANGQNDFLNNNMIDGMDNNERYFGTIVVRPSIDAVQEVNVSTNLYPAEVSRTEGGVVNVITKSGTNTFHGSLYEYLRNDILDARNYFATTGPRPELRQNQFGGSIGGPIRKNKTFFFGDYEGFRQVWAKNTYTSTVPTAAQESLVAATAEGQTIQAGSALGNTSPVVVSDLGKNLFSLYPAPMSSGTTNNFVYSPANTQFSNTFDVRVNHHFSDRDLLFARYSFNDVETYTPGGLLPDVSINGKTYGPNNPPGSTGGPALERAQNLGLAHIHVFRPRLLLELKLAYLRFANQSLTINGPDAGVELGFDSCSLGTGYCMNSDSGGAKYGLPAVFLAPPYTGLGDTLFAPLFDYNNTFQYQGSLTWNHGAHNVKTGASVIRRQLKWQQSISPRGVYSVNGTFTGSALGDLIAGYASDAQFQNDVAFPHFRSWEFGGYIQDDWRATRWLTLNLGVRYDTFTPFTEVDGYISNFDTATAFVVSPILSGPNHGTSTANVKTDFSNVSPRLGFSASLGRRMVLRGGFGLSYFPNQIGNAGTLQNVPLVVSRDCGGDSAYPVQCPSAIAGPGGVGLTMARGLWEPAIDPASADYPNEEQGTGVAAGTEIDAAGNNLKSGRVAQFALQLQQELRSNLVFSLGYVGNLGRYLPVVPNINQATYATYSYSGPGCTIEGKPTYSSSCFTQGPIPYPDYGGDQIYLLQSASNSNYNALQASFVRSFAAGLTANVNYTWSHILNNGSPEGEGGFRPVECVRNGCLMDSGNGTPIPVNSFLQYDYGNADLDVRQRFAMMFDYSLPFGRSLQGAAAYLARGWSVNAIFAYSTGLPTSVSEPGGGPPGTITNASGIAGFRGGDAPNQVRDPNTGKNIHTIEEWFNTSAFAVQAPGLLGNSRRNCVFGPPLRHLDFSVTKTFPIREILTLQFRAESFNLTNTPNFAEPNTSLGSPTFGEITSTAPFSNPRLLQFALRLSF